MIACHGEAGGPRSVARRPSCGWMFWFCGCDTYRPGDDIGELLDGTRFSTVEGIERHLIARFGREPVFTAG